MTTLEFLQDTRPSIAAVEGRYLLQGQHLRTGNAVAESFVDLKSAVARASELIRAGYTIEIWSSASLEKPSSLRS